MQAFSNFLEYLWYTFILDFRRHLPIQAAHGSSQQLADWTRSRHFPVELGRILFWQIVPLIGFSFDSVPWHVRVIKE
jgi:hypothetical protein